MGDVRVFWCEPTGDCMVVRAYECEVCQHWTRLPLGRFKEDVIPDYDFGAAQTCGACGQVKAKLKAVSFPRIYRRADDGKEINPNGEQVGPGAVYAYAAKYDYPTGADGRALVCVLPDGTHWHIDGRANNCTRPDDDMHRCWPRTGSPEAGDLHVTKDGDTCSAGAGSIATGRWHGFLHHGVLRAC